MDAPTLAANRIARFLEREPVVWLSSVGADGKPYLVPIWFWWDGEAVVVFSKPDAQKVRNLRANPVVMLALGDAEDDFDVGLIHGRAELLDRPASEVVPPEHLAKYAGRLATIGLDAEAYAAIYSQVIRIVPDDFLDWHGRTTPRSKRLAGAPAVSIAEPRRDGSLAFEGEPMGRRRPRVKPSIVNPTTARRNRPGWLRRPLALGLRGLTDGLGQPGPLPIGAL